MSFDEILNEIENHDIITIFRHQRPDCDAFGSQFAMKEWLSINYPNKQIYACGYEMCNQSTWPDLDVVDDETMRKSLAISLDCSNLQRVDDQRISTALKVIKIDHHPNWEPYGDIQYVDSESAATSEILTDLIQYADKKMNDTVALYLYRGLLTDTLQFSTSNTRNNTLEKAAYLTKFSLNIADINRDLFDVSIETFRYANYLRNKTIIDDGGFAYVVLNQEDLKQWNITGSNARNSIDEIGHIKEFKAWAIFTESETKDVYDGSLRSKKVVVNELASKYHGGGHKNASGVNSLTKEELQQIIDDLIRLCAEN